MMMIMGTIIMTIPILSILKQNIHWALSLRERSD
jgi:hypothetical protein